MAYETGSDRVSSVIDPVTGTISYTYRISGERQTMTLPGGGTWTYGYTDVNAIGGPGGAGMPYPSNNGHFGDPNNPFNGGPWAPTQGIWIMPKGDPDSLSLLPNKITDDQGRTAFYMLNFAGQMLTAANEVERSTPTGSMMLRATRSATWKPPARSITPTRSSTPTG